MEENIKNRFKNEYGEDNYRIIENYNLWLVKRNILRELESVIFNYSHNQFLKNSGSRVLRGKIRIFSDSEERLIDIFKSKNLDEESLSKLRKAIFCLEIFKMNLEFENQPGVTVHYRA